MRATHRVGFDVQAAERFVLLGTSGCRKSSLLKAAAGFLPPREGEIRLYGQPIHEPGADSAGTSSRAATSSPPTRSSLAWPA